MSETKIPFGKPVKLLVDLQGFPDGRLILYEIWRKKEGNEEKIAEVNGVVRSGKGIGYWNPKPPQIEERKDVLPLVKTISQNTETEKFYFKAKIDDKEVQSTDLTFTYSLDIYLESVNGKRLSGAKYSITLPDGTKVDGTLVGDHIKVAEVPSGKFKIEMDDYEFAFDQTS